MITSELLWCLPFAFLLLSIAVLPLLNKHFWEKNYPLISLGLGSLVCLYYLFIEKHPAVLLHTGMEYFSFIVLIGSLFVVSGGIHIQVKGEATPLANCVFLFIGCILANFLGTTGASMVLIRPWIRMNKYRLTAFHIVFFIFLVSNIGGALTPIGDPPLFLGYLKGVPFFWVLEHLWPLWLTVVAFVLSIFYVLDSRNYARAPKNIAQHQTSAGETWKFEGAHNCFFLALILCGVFVNNPPFLREGIMIIAAILSLVTTPKNIHEKNDFSFGPIQEVAILFLGIFSTMIPALEWLEHHAAEIGIRSAGQFFWASGSLSAVLDNAPTYLNFLSAAQGLLVSPDVPEHARTAVLLQTQPKYIQAISAGAVFFGAMTYIGNGPNFLVKSIADQSKAKTPSFFEYITKYSLPVLLPAFFLVWLIFFRG